MRRARALLVLTAALALTGCANTPATPEDSSADNGQQPTAEAVAPPPVAAPAGVQILPPSGHVTGHYPASCHITPTNRPDPVCTPGAASSAVTQANIGSTICVRGYTSRPGIRAPQSETGPVKIAAMKAYGESPGSIGTTELDHLVPLTLGGSNSVENLWPEPSDIPNAGFLNTKDLLEVALAAAVCARKVTLAAAQSAIANNWVTAEHNLSLK